MIQTELDDRPPTNVDVTAGVVAESLYPRVSYLCSLSWVSN